MLRGEGECRQIGVKAPLDARPQNLHGDGAGTGRCRHRRAMNLRNRGGGNRRAEARENRVDRFAEGGGDRRLCVGLGKWRHAVLQALEVARQRGADHVRPGREKLPKFDIARPELSQRR